MRLADPTLAQLGSPRVTAWMDVSRDNENAANEVQLRWRALRETLEKEGASEAALSLVEERMLEVTHVDGPAWRIVVADDERVIADYTSPGHHSDGAGWGPVPRLAPILLTSPADAPHVVVRLDRTGAELTVHARGKVVEEEVEGQNGPIRKVHPGGWSQRRFQNRAEDTWIHTAAEVAEHIDAIAREVQPVAIVLAGDIRMMPILQERLGESSRPVTVVAEHGGRADGIDEQTFAEELDRILTQAYHEHLTEIVERWREQRSKDGAAAEGLAATASALRQGQVDTLLLPEGWSDEREALCGEDPTQLALDQGEADAMGLQEPVTATVEDALLRAAIGTDAEVVTVPEAVLDLGGEPAALLRWSD